MFRFNFTNDESTHRNLINEECKKDEIILHESKEIFYDEKEEIKNLRNNSTLINILKHEDLEIKYLKPTDVIDTLEKDDENSIFNAEKNHSDLISGIYEGGLKIWECTFDLLNLLVKLNLSDTKILDLGCGNGIIGIFSLLKGANCCYFQDYNIEVIKNITIPNILHNFDKEILKNKCKLYCGDWTLFLNEIQSNFINENNKFDYIFTSETIYNINNYSKLFLIFKSLLKTNGIIYLAAKSHYFGIGGGTSIFQKYLNKQDFFNSEICWKYSNGMNREILKITLK